MSKINIKREIKKIESTENKIYDDVEYVRYKDKYLKSKLLSRVKKFTFSDFAQAVIGTAVFSLPAFINTSFWDYVPKISTTNLVITHLFFVFCIFIALNYTFRESFSFNIYFFADLIRRMFYLYVSVLITVIILLWMIERILPLEQIIGVLRSFLIAQSVGLIGAVTFSFFSKNG